MFSRVYSAQTNALQGHIITIEVDISKSFLHAFSIVGLPDKAVEEARDRVSSAIKNSGFENPNHLNIKLLFHFLLQVLKKKDQTMILLLRLVTFFQQKKYNLIQKEKFLLVNLV